MAQQLADEKKLLEDEVEKLKARLQEADEQLNREAEEFLKNECAVLLQRMRILVREKRAKVVEEEAARAGRLSRRYIHDGSVGGRGCPVHREAVQMLYGNNAMSELLLPLLQCSRMSAATPTPEDPPAASTVMASPAATPQAEVKFWFPFDLFSPTSQLTTAM